MASPTSRPTREIDYSAFDGLIAEQLLQQNGGERMRQAINGILDQGAEAAAVPSRLLEILPTFTGHAKQLEVIAAYLKAERG